MGNCGSQQTDASKTVAPASPPSVQSPINTPPPQAPPETEKQSEISNPEVVQGYEGKSDPISEKELEVVKASVDGSDDKEVVAESERLFPESKTGFLEKYDFGDVLGSGSFSTVKQAHDRETGQAVAVKCIKRKTLPPDEIDALKDEVSILKQISHPNIIHMHDFFEEPENYYLVMEVMSGGELFDRIVQKSYYNEKEARDLVKILLDAICYMHDRNIVHRDLKPENLLLQNRDNDSEIRLADFGFAKRVKGNLSLSTQCGTPGYVAPEILKGDKYGLAVDMWSIGVITYILLGGYPPFHDDNQATLYKKIKSGDFVFHPEYWDPVSKEAKDLITRMLTVDYEKRLTAKDALNHPWIHDMSDGELQSHDLHGTLDEIKKFNARRKLKGTIKAVMAATKMKRLIESLTKVSKKLNEEAEGGQPAAPEKIVDLLGEDAVAELKAEFTKFDENGDGSIESAELKTVMNNCGKFPTDELLTQMVAEADTDKNGTIEFAEFVVMFTNLVKGEDEQEGQVVKEEDVQEGNVVSNDSPAI